MLYEFGISGYRSFGPDPQFIAPLGQINVFAGQNNATCATTQRTST